MNNRLLLCFALLFLAATSAVKSTDSLSTLHKIVERNANELLAQDNINATSIVVSYKGTAHIAHFGELTKGQGDAPNNQTIYEIGSASKTFTGALVAKAVLENKLSLSSNITDFLPENEKSMKAIQSPITIRHLLTHTSGLPNMVPQTADELMRDFTNRQTPVKLNRVLAEYSTDDFLSEVIPLSKQSRSDNAYSYSSVGTELLAYILEKVYEKDFEELLAAFTNDLKMSDTLITLNANNGKRLAIGYHVDNQRAAPAMTKVAWGAAGNIKSTAPDILKYLEFQLDSNNPIAKEAQRVLFDDANGNKLAYKWNVSEDPYYGQNFKHHGGVPRAQNYLFIAPSRQLGIFIITNQSGNKTAAVLNETLKCIMNDLRD